MADPAAPYVPYQAYKSKRHSRNLSNPLVPTIATNGANGLSIPPGPVRSASAAVFPANSSMNSNVLSVNDDHLDVPHSPITPPPPRSPPPPAALISTQTQHGVPFVPTQSSMHASIAGSPASVSSLGLAVPPLARFPDPRTPDGSPALSLSPSISPVPSSSSVHTRTSSMDGGPPSPSPQGHTQSHAQGNAMGPGMAWSASSASASSVQSEDPPFASASLEREHILPAPAPVESYTLESNPTTPLGPQPPPVSSVASGKARDTSGGTSVSNTTITHANIASTPGTSSGTPTPAETPRKASKFRRMPLNSVSPNTAAAAAAHTPHASSPLRPLGAGAGSRPGSNGSMLSASAVPLATARSLDPALPPSLSSARPTLGVDGSGSGARSPSSTSVLSTNSGRSVLSMSHLHSPLAQPQSLPGSGTTSEGLHMPGYGQGIRAAPPPRLSHMPASGQGPSTPVRSPGLNSSTSSRLSMTNGPASPSSSVNGAGSMMGSTPARMLSPAPGPGISTPSSVRPGTPGTPSTPSGAPHPAHSQHIPQQHTQQPYRPGFQPKGVYRPRTDEFLAARAAALSSGSKAVERARLERRLEKVLKLHYPGPEDARVQGEKAGSSTTTLQGSPGKSPGKMTMSMTMPKAMRRASSLFEMDLGELRGKSAGELFRGVLAPNGARDLRAAEQRITPWQDDNAVSACPFCSTNFHPLTNRKHHCRLCGRVVCSLPPRAPARPTSCSGLFAVDAQSGRLEEVVEGVDYGVRRRTSSTMGVGGGGMGGAGGEEEKGSKGVRVCKECKPVLLRQQYADELRRRPLFSRLYQALIELESEIEDDLPVFHELMLALSTTGGTLPTPSASTPSAPGGAPGGSNAITKEASEARRRLLEAFSQYDALSKKIRSLPAPSTVANGSVGATTGAVAGAGTGAIGSQERVQAAILLRANLFLQKNMFPLQSLPKPSSNSNGAGAGAGLPGAEGGLAGDGTPQPLLPAVTDADAAAAHALQPLLEQEALLEGFAAEAAGARRLEDAKALRASLKEIRVEIGRIVSASDRGEIVGAGVGGGGTGAGGAGGAGGGLMGMVAGRGGGKRK